MKQCPTCEKMLPTYGFYKDRTRSDGLYRECKQCKLLSEDKRRLLRHSQRLSLVEKKCATCGITKLAQEFNKHRGKSDGLQSYCRDCQRAKAQKRYSEKFSVTGNLVNQIKEELGCVDCKINYPSYVLDFDHVSGVKRANISVMVKRLIDFKEILAEIEKCEVVCANCHRIRTHRRRIERAG